MNVDRSAHIGHWDSRIEVSLEIEISKTLSPHSYAHAYIWSQIYVFLGLTICLSYYKFIFNNISIQMFQGFRVRFKHRWFWSYWMRRNGKTKNKNKEFWSTTSTSSFPIRNFVLLFSFNFNLLSLSFKLKLKLKLFQKDAIERESNLNLELNKNKRNKIWNWEPKVKNWKSKESLVKKS